MITDTDRIDTISLLLHANHHHMYVKFPTITQDGGHFLIPLSALIDIIALRTDMFEADFYDENGRFHVRFIHMNEVVEAVRNREFEKINI